MTLFKMILVVFNWNQVIQVNQTKNMKDMVVKHNYLQFVQQLVVVMVLIMKMKIQSMKMKRLTHILIRVMIQYTSIHINVGIILLYQIRLNSNPIDTDANKEWTLVM